MLFLVLETWETMLLFKSWCCAKLPNACTDIYNLLWEKYGGIIHMQYIFPYLRQEKPAGVIVHIKGLCI